jgi:hypothetical protein
MMLSRAWFALCITLLLAMAWACSPRLNWRTVQLPQGSLMAQFPCKPDHLSRRLPLGVQAVEVDLSSCAAGEQMFAITGVDMKTADRAAEGVQFLRNAAEKNWSGGLVPLAPPPWPGLQSPSHLQYVAAQLVSASGQARRAQMLFFAHGAWVYQATVMGQQLEQEALDSFFEGLLVVR